MTGHRGWWQLRSHGLTGIEVQRIASIRWESVTDPSGEPWRGATRPGTRAMRVAVPAPVRHLMAGAGVEVTRTMFSRTPAILARQHSGRGVRIVERDSRILSCVSGSDVESILADPTPVEVNDEPTVVPTVISAVAGGADR